MIDLNEKLSNLEQRLRALEKRSNTFDTQDKAGNFTAGSVLFGGTNGNATQDNASLYFDNTNNRLGILTTSPQRTVDVRSSITISGNILSTNNGVYSTGTNAGLVFEDRTSAQDWQWYGQSSVARLYNGTTDTLTVTDAGLTSINYEDAGTGTAPRVLTINRTTTGTASTSFGSSISFNAEASAGSLREAGLIQVVWTDATDTTRNSDMRFFGSDGNGGTNNLREGFRVGSTSANAAGIGFFAGGVTAKQTVTGSKGGNAALASLLTALAAYGLVTDSST